METVHSAKKRALARRREEGGQEAKASSGSMRGPTGKSLLLLLLVGWMSPPCSSKSMSLQETEEMDVNELVELLGYCRNSYGKAAIYDPLLNQCVCSSGFSFDGQLCVPARQVQEDAGGPAAEGGRGRQLGQEGSDKWWGEGGGKQGGRGESKNLAAEIEKLSKGTRRLPSNAITAKSFSAVTMSAKDNVHFCTYTVTKTPDEQLKGEEERRSRRGAEAAAAAGEVQEREE